MKTNSLSKLGGTCSILLGVSYIVVGVTYVLLPAEQKAGGNPALFLPSFAQNPTLLMIQYWAFALGAVLALAVVPAVSETVRSANEGWVRWTSNLAFLGFAVTAIDVFRTLGLQPGRAAAFVAGDATTKAVLTAPGYVAGLDVQGWLGFGGVGLWVLVISLLALRGSTWPKPLAYVGIAVAILYWFVVAGLALGVETLVTIAAGLGGVIGAPVWYIWAGLTLRRANLVSAPNQWGSRLTQNGSCEYLRGSHTAR